MNTRKKKQVIVEDPLMDIDDQENSQQQNKNYKNGKSSIKNIVQLGESLTIQEVTGLMQAIRELFDSGMDITIDPQNVQRIDGAGIQLLSAVVKEAVTQNIDIIWQCDSDVIMRAASELGLQKHLKLIA